MNYTVTRHVLDDAGPHGIVVMAVVQRAGSAEKVNIALPSFISQLVAARTFKYGREFTTVCAYSRLASVEDTYIHVSSPSLIRRRHGLCLDRTNATTCSLGPPAMTGRTSQAVRGTKCDRRHSVLRSR